MKALLDFIYKKEQILKNKKPVEFLDEDSNENNILDENIEIDSFHSHLNNLKAKNNIIINNKNFFDTFENIAKLMKYSDEYKNKVLILFLNFFEYLKNSNSLSININKKENNISFLSLKRINITDIEYFVKTSKKYKKKSSLNFILSLMRKFVRLFNDEPNLNYREKIGFTNKINTKDLSYRQQVVMLKYLKEKCDVEILLIYFFLYYLGFSYSAVSRILISHFLKNFSLLKIKKGKIKRYKIIPSISKIIIKFVEESKTKKKFLFCDEIKESNNLTRVNYIKQKIREVIKKCYRIYESQLNYILNLFCKTRQPKKIVNKLNDFFDENVGISNGWINSEISNFYYDDNLEENDNIIDSSMYLNTNINNNDGYYSKDFISSFNEDKSLYNNKENYSSFGNEFEIENTIRNKNLNSISDLNEN